MMVIMVVMIVSLFVVVMLTEFVGEYGNVGCKGGVGM